MSWRKPIFAETSKFPDSSCSSQWIRLLNPHFSVTDVRRNVFAKAFTKRNYDALLDLIKTLYSSLLRFCMLSISLCPHTEEQVHRTKTMREKNAFFRALIQWKRNRNNMAFKVIGQIFWIFTLSYACTHVCVVYSNAPTALASVFVSNEISCRISDSCR